jgi:hypothetical protein
MIAVHCLSISLVFAHCGQVVEKGKIKAINKPNNKAKMMNLGKVFTALGATYINNFRSPLGDWKAPKQYIGLKPDKAYAQMLQDKMTVRDLFESVIAKEKIVENHYQGEYGPNTCGFWDPDYIVEIPLDANPQSTTTGNNHNGPAEVWMDDVRTSHISNLHGAQPEVLSRHKYDCNKEYCVYRWYWIAFRGHQKNPTFQMWVQCAKVAGNNKSPIQVEPTGKWLVDPREATTPNGSDGKLVPTENKVGLAISDNSSERKSTGGNQMYAPNIGSKNELQSNELQSNELPVSDYYNSTEEDQMEPPGDYHRDSLWNGWNIPQIGDTM